MDIEEQRTPTRQSLPRSARLARIEKRAQEQRQARNVMLARARMRELVKEQEELAKLLGGTSLSDEGKNYAKRVDEQEEIKALVAAMTNKVKIPQSTSSRARGKSRGKSRGKKKPSQKNTPNFVFQGLSEATFNLPSSGASVTASDGGPDVLSESMGGMNLRMPRRRSKSRRKVSRKKSRRRSKSRRKVSKKKFQKKSRVGCWGGICGAPENVFPNKQPPSLPKEERARLQAAREEEAAAKAKAREEEAAAAEAEAEAAAAEAAALGAALEAIKDEYAKIIRRHSCLSKRYITRKITCEEKKELNRIRRDYLGLGEVPWGGCDPNEENAEKNENC